MRIFNVADLGGTLPENRWLAFQALSNVWTHKNYETYYLVIELLGKDDSSNLSIGFPTKEERDTALAKLLDWWGQA